MKRLALMIGIDDYPNLKKRYHLKGCVNDQQILYDLLIERFEFEPHNIELLLNSQATRANILDALDCLAGIGEYEGESVVDEGDLVLISYSGHGSRLQEPPDRQDEPDGYDSTIVPYDSGRAPPVGLGGQNLDITDDEIVARLERIKERADHVVLLFDCCHSGTMSRDLEGGIARTLPEDDHYGDVERMNSVATTRSLEKQEKKTQKGPSGWLPLDEGYILIAACRDDELAYEYRHPQTKQACGALSYHLVQELLQSQGELTYHDLFKRVEAGVNRIYSRQHPQMEGDLTRNVLSMDKIEVEPFVAVEARLHEYRVKIAAGSAHGATVGSLWEIRPADLTRDEVLAEVIIRAVGALSSEAESNEPLPNEVNQGCRAIEVVHTLGDLRVAVAVDGVDHARMNQLREQIEQSTLLTLAKEGPVEMVAVLLPTRGREDLQHEQRYAPEMGAIEVPTWVIVGRDRHMLPAPPHSIDEEEALDVTYSNLETRARYLNTQRIRPVGADPLRDQFSMKLMFSDGTPLPTHQKSGLPLILDGHHIRLELINHYSEPLYYTLLNLDAVGGINHLWPPAHAQEPIMPYEGYPMEFPLTLPDNFPDMLDGARESLKVMITTEYVNFDTMTQEGARVGDTNDIANWYGAATESGEVATVSPMSADIDQNSWTVVQLDYYLKRN